MIDCEHGVLQGLSQVIFVVATGKQLLFRQYAIAFKKSGAQVPRTELAEIGPRFDFSIRRSRAAPEEIQTQSMKQPKVEKKKVGFPSSVVHTFVFCPCLRRKRLTLPMTCMRSCCSELSVLHAHAVLTTNFI